MTHHSPLTRALPLLLGILFAGPALADKADPVGEVSTAFKLVGPNHKILVEALTTRQTTGKGWARRAVLASSRTAKNSSSKPYWLLA